MKSVWHGIGFLLVFLVACTQPDNDHCRDALNASPQDIISPTLSAIDSLLWQQPDSALMRLLPYFDTCIATEYNRHYAHLLLAELLYKNDYAQTNRAELQQAVAYFDSLVRQVSPPFKGAGGIKNKNSDSSTHAFLDARAHYINGVGYYENDSAVPACAEYMKALEVMEGHFTEKELVGKKAKFMALTYTHLSHLFSDQYLHEQSIYFGRRSLSYYYKHDAVNWHKAWMLVEIGSHFDMMEQLDSANFYYCRAMQVLTDTFNLTYRDIVAHQAFLKYKMGKQTENALSQLHDLLAKAESDRELSARNLSIAEIYYYEKVYDSAKIYYNHVLNETGNANSKILTAQRLQEIYRISDDTTNANTLSLYLSQFANTGDEQGELHSQLTELYHDYKQKKMEILHRQQAKKDHKAIIGIILGLLASIAIITLLYFVNKKRNTRLQNEKAETEIQLEAERRAHKVQQAALAGRLKKSNESLRDVSQQLENTRFSQNAVSEKVETQANFSAFMGSPVCDHILKTVEERNFKPKVDCLIYKDYALDKKQLTALVRAADSHLGHFTERIRKKYPTLTNDDMKYCCLYLLGLNEADISALMQRAYSTVCERNRKIKRILGTEGDLSIALKELI